MNCDHCGYGTWYLVTVEVEGREAERWCLQCIRGEEEED